MLHGGSVDGPHDHAPDYDLNNFHIHAQLEIWVDSERVEIPAAIGIDNGEFLAPIHTHENDNELHLHNVNGEVPDDFITLGDFFNTWQTNGGDAGNNPNAVLSESQLFDNFVGADNSLQMIVNGVAVDSFEDYQIHDGDRIILVYGANPIVTFNTNVGSIVMELLPEAAPNTVANFLNYVRRDTDGYVGTVFHRADPNFVIQGGGFAPASLTTTDVDDIQNAHIPTDPPIATEFNRSNAAGTIAMAKNAAGATSEFFFNSVDNASLNNDDFTVFALALDRATFDAIDALPKSDLTPGVDSIVFENVPYTAAGELVVIESIAGGGTIRGTVFNDIDLDGIRNPEDAGLPDATVYIDANNNGALDDDEVSTVTAVDGSYFFHVEGGTYIIRQIPPNGFTQTSPDTPDSQMAIIEIGSVVNDVDFGNDGFSDFNNSISGFVYLDLNNDGIRNANEQGISGATVTLSGADDIGTPVSRVLQTGEDGSYGFENLASGQYSVIQTQPIFMNDGSDTIGSQGGDASVNDRFEITLLEGTQGVDNNFAELGRSAQFASISDYIIELAELANFASRFDDTILAATNTTDGPIWASLGNGWDGFVSAEVELTNDETSVVLNVVDSSQDEFTTTLSIFDFRVSVLGRDGDVVLLRLLGDSAAFAFVPV